MATKIRPSRYYYVRDNNSFQACLALMEEKNLTFLLIENHVGRLLGIFTLKDLLKHHTVLKNDSHMSKPIRLFMSKPVISIQDHQIHKAPEIMLENKINHLPVLSERKGESDRVLGVVDIEALLAHYLAENKREKYKSKDISIYSPNGALLRLMKEVLKRYDRLQVDKIWASRLKTVGHVESQVSEYDLLFFDLSEAKDIKFALRFLPVLNKVHKRMICLTSRHTFQEDPEKTQLAKLAKHSRVKVFYKPFEVHDLVFECLS